MQKQFSYPLVHCKQGGASLTAPLSSLPTFDYNTIGDLALNWDDYVIKIINKSIYGFRSQVASLSSIFYISDITDSTSPLDTVAFTNGIETNFEKYLSYAVKGKNIVGQTNQELCLIIKYSGSNDLKLTCTNTGTLGATSNTMTLTNSDSDFFILRNFEVSEGDLVQI